MRILMSTPFFYEPPQAKIGTMRLAAQLALRGHSVLVVSSAVENASRLEVTREGVKIIRQRVLYLKNLPLTVPYGLNALQRAISDFSPDVIHAHESIFPTSTASVLCAKLYNIPFVLTLHGMISEKRHFMFSLLSRFAESTISSFTARAADRVIVLNEPLIARASRLGVKRSRIAVIPNGIEIEIDKSQGLTKRETMGIHKGSFVVGFIGRLYPIKGIAYLSEAIKEILKVDDSIVFVFAGDGPLRGLVESLVNQFPKNCIYKGYVSAASKMIPAFDVLILPSISEGLPTVLIEALASGVPAITTDIPENAAVIENNRTGVLVKPANAQSIFDAILYLRSKDLSAMKFNCIQVAKQRYKWDIILNRVEKLYQESIINHHGKKA